MKQQHTPECLSRKREFMTLRLSDCDLEECDCSCHADPEPFDENDNRYKWPEDRR